MVGSRHIGLNHIVFFRGWIEAGEHGVDAQAWGVRKAARNERLRRRQLAVLAKLESLLAEAPQPEHQLDGWLDPATARRLAAVGIDTVQQLREYIAYRGHRWYSKIPPTLPAHGYFQ